MKKTITPSSRLETAKADYLATVYEKKTAILNSWDAVDSSNKKKRRKTKIELAEEGGSRGQLPPLDRLKAVNLGRDLYRNYTAAKATLLQIRLNVAGTGPKLIINQDNDNARAAEAWFNGAYSKDCDGRDDTPFGEFVGLGAMAIFREADFLVFFDDSINDDGKLYFWEADQFATICKKDWENPQKNPNYPADKFTCEDGIIFEKKMGRIVAYSVSAIRGMTEYKMEQVTILKRESARHVKMPWRFNQRRGTSEILTAGGHYQDAYEILSSELQTAKVAAKWGMTINRKNDDGFETLVDNNIDPDTSLSGGETDVKKGESPQLYERLEALAGGYINYLEDGDEAKVLDFNRPSANIKDYLEYLTVTNGASVGLFSCYSTGKVSTSYTAFRGEQILTQPTFEFVQKLLERRMCDWIASKAISWGTRKGFIKALEAGWQAVIAFQWPVMREVNELAAASANETKLKTAQTDFQQLLGPQWKQKLQNYATQVDWIRELKLPLSIFETKAGAPTENANQKTDANSEDTDTKTGLLNWLKRSLFNEK